MQGRCQSLTCGLKVLIYKVFWVERRVYFASLCG